MQSDTVIGLEGQLVELADGSELEILFTPRRVRAVEKAFNALESFLPAMRAQPMRNIAWTIALHRGSRQGGALPSEREIEVAYDLIRPRSMRMYVKAIGDALADALGGMEPVEELHQHLAAIEALLPRLEPEETVSWIRSTLAELREAVPLPPQIPTSGRGGSPGAGTSTSPLSPSASIPSPSGTA